MGPENSLLVLSALHKASLLTQTLIGFDIQRLPPIPLDLFPIVIISLQTHRANDLGLADKEVLDPAVQRLV